MNKLKSFSLRLNKYKTAYHKKDVLLKFTIYNWHLLIYSDV